MLKYGVHGEKKDFNNKRDIRAFISGKSRRDLTLHLSFPLAGTLSCKSLIIHCSIFCFSRIKAEAET